MADKIKIDERIISIKRLEGRDYLSLTDMGQSDDIKNWLRNKNTIEFLGIWEQLHNPDFNWVEFDLIMREAGLNRFKMSAKKWIESTQSIGLFAKAGRYGGTYAHKDIAFEFGSWISPKFKLLLIKEFDRLKSEEYQRNKLEWDTSRFISKINYSVQTNAIESIPQLIGKEKGFAYASEADIINLAVFGKTAKQWREENPEVRGNIRDSASLAQLIILSNLETHNADYIHAGASKEARFQRLCEISLRQMEIFKNDKRLNDDKKFLE